MAEFELLIADPSYSSWSLRGWLAFAAFDIPVKVKVTRLYDDSFAKDLQAFHPAKTVPVARASNGALFTDSLTIIEELAQIYPDKGLLPKDPILRARARSMMAEMHSSFTTLRSDCPMNTRTAYQAMPISDKLQADLDRLCVIWDCLDTEKGDFLCGDYSAVDAFFAPVAARIASYNLPVSDKALAYVNAHLNHLPFRQFRAWGLSFDAQDAYIRPYETTNWPGPKPRSARPTYDMNAVNDLCPYSGKPTEYYLEYDAKIYGFCNERCRDKTLYDPEAWPDFMALVDASS